MQGHNCTDKAKVRQLQRLNGYHGCCSCCCDCCSYGCQDTCSNCGDSCCRQCGDCCISDCCESLISCQHDCGVGCILWNIFSIPVRIILILLTITLFLLFSSLWLALLCLWLVLCRGGGWGVMCQVICDSQCQINLLMLLFLPVVYLYGVLVAIRQTGKQPIGMICSLAETFGSCMADIWIKLSPRRCLD